MEFTDIIQQGYAYNVGDGTVKYRLETSVNTAGELPSTHIFVHSISTADTPGSDEFERVATVADLTDLPQSRDDAVDGDLTDYLSNYMEVQYDSLDVAKQAKAMVASRINELIRTWITFRDEFAIDTDVTQYFPTASSTEEETLKQAYVDAKEARIKKEEEVADKAEEISDAEETSSRAAEIVVIYENERWFCDEILNGQFAEYVSKLDTEGAAALAYRTTTLQPSFTAFCANANAQFVAWSNTKQASDQNVADLTTEKAALDAELVAAQQAEDEALAAVLAVCPDFDSASV